MYLFAYGTLQFAEIQKALLGTYLEGSPAVLSNYRLEIVAGYPNIIAAQGYMVKGYVYQISESNLAACNWWEDVPTYELVNAVVNLVESNRPQPCSVYQRKAKIEDVTQFITDYQLTSAQIAEIAKIVKTDKPAHL